MIDISITAIEDTDGKREFTDTGISQFYRFVN
jgi:hypothetical protein